MKHFSTNRLSTSTFSSFCVAFATADLTTFSISRVDFGLFVNFNVISASFTSLPRIKSTASRAFCGDMRINLPVALLIIFTSLSARARDSPRRHQHLRPLRRLLEVHLPERQLYPWNPPHCDL